MGFMEESILHGLSAISPQAAEFIRECGASVLWSSHKDCVVKSVLDDMGILFASLSPDAPELAYQILNDELRALSLEDHLGERCFNCRGDDNQSRELAALHGFHLEMAGYFLELESLPASAKIMPGLRLWDLEDTEDWLVLMVEAYRDLCVANAWDPEAILRNREAFIQDMTARAARCEVWSLFQEGRLVAGYRLNGAFIEDLVVLPEYQNRGLGCALLHDAIQQITQNRHPKVCLRVAEANTGALRLYLREGFFQISHFAEHGFHKKVLQENPLS